DVDADQLDLAVRSADAGLVLLDLPIAATSLAIPASLVAPAPLTEPLTARELQVLQLVAQGLPNKGIARRLGISENTAKFHVQALRLAADFDGGIRPSQRVEHLPGRSRTPVVCRGAGRSGGRSHPRADC